MKTKILSELLSLLLIILASCSREVLNESLTISGNPLVTPVSLDYNMHIIKNYEFEDLKKLTSARDDELISEIPAGFGDCTRMVLEMTAGNYIDAGDITVSDDKDYFYIIYATKGGWTIDEIHLYLGIKENIPLNGSNVPFTGQFPIKETFPAGAEMVVFRIIKSNVTTDCPVILANATVSRSGQSGITAWGHGNKTFAGYFDTKRWGFIADNLCAGNLYAAGFPVNRNKQ